MVGEKSLQEPFVWNQQPELVGDCRLVLLTQLLRFYDTAIEPYDIFGYGEGLGFQLDNMKLSNKVELVSVWGRKLECGLKFCEDSSIPLVKAKSNEPEIELLDPELLAIQKEKGPIIVAVDRFFLDFLKIKKAHFGYHVVMIKDFDVIHKTVDILDVMSSKVETISLQALKSAMYVKLDFASPNGDFYYINDNFGYQDKSVNDFKRAVLNQATAFLEKGGAAENMLELSRFLKKFGKRGKKNKKYQCYLEYQIPVLRSGFKEQEASGTFYRQLYLQFLKENGKLFNMCKEIKMVLEDFERDVYLWKTIYSDRNALDGTIFQQTEFIAERLDEIAALEKNIFSKLKKIIIDA